MGLSPVPLPPVSQIRFFLPFPDGTLHYDCPSCTALCCRGKGFAGSLKREVPELLRIYPALAASVVGRNGNVVSFQNAAGGCSFLATDNRCQIEERHGFGLKPGVCGLFPFNNFSRIAPDVVVLSPHFLCPLQVVSPARPGWAAGTHEAVRAAAVASGLVDSGSFATRRRPAAEAGEAAERLLQREEQFRDRCSEALGVSRFRDALFAQSAAHEELADWLRRAAAVLALEAQDAVRDDFDEKLLVLSCSWRMDLLQMEAEDALRVLALAEVILRRQMFAQSPTPQQLAQAFGRLVPVLKMLAQGDKPAQFAGGRMAAPRVNDAMLATVGLRVLGEASRGGVLQAMERFVPTEMSQADRFALSFDLSLQFKEPLPRENA